MAGHRYCIDPSAVAPGPDGATTVTRLATDQPSVTLADGGRSISISLESEGTGTVVADSDSASFRNVAAKTDAEIRAIPGGAQLFSVMRDSSASSTQSYQLGLPAGTQVSAIGDGGYLLIDEAAQPVSRIDAPWAVDAAGKSLPTSYQLHGNTLVQSTSTEGATYPVVADPKVFYGLRIYVRYQRSEVKDFRDRGKFIGAGVLVTAACGKIPLGWLVVACGASAAVVSASVPGTFQNAANQNRCVELQFNYQRIRLSASVRKSFGG